MSLLCAMLRDSLLNTVMQSSCFLTIRPDKARGAGIAQDPSNCSDEDSPSVTKVFSFDNQNSTGVLIRGFHSSTGLHDGDLIEDA